MKKHNENDQSNLMTNKILSHSFYMIFLNYNFVSSQFAIFVSFDAIREVTAYFEKH